MSDFDRVIELVGEAAVLRYHLRSAIEWASHGHVPPRELIDLWRQVAGEHEIGGREAGVTGLRGDDDGARRIGRDGAGNPVKAGSIPGAPSSSEVGR